MYGRRQKPPSRKRLVYRMKAGGEDAWEPGPSTVVARMKGRLLASPSTGIAQQRQCLWCISSGPCAEAPLRPLMGQRWSVQVKEWKCFCCSAAPGPHTSTSCVVTSAGSNPTPPEQRLVNLAADAPWNVRLSCFTKYARIPSHGCLSRKCSHSLIAQTDCLSGRARPLWSRVRMGQQRRVSGSLVA